MRSSLTLAGLLAISAGHAALANPIDHGVQVPLKAIADSHTATGIGTLTHGPMSAGDPTPQACNYTRYTALGDSYACGFNSGNALRPCNNNEKWSSPDCSFEKYGGDPHQSCGKNDGGYPWQFWHQNSGSIKDFRYLACNGNDTGSVLRWQINGDEFGKPDLITVNFGGDDGSWFADAAAACLNPLAYASSKCDAAIQRANGIIAGEQVNIAESFKTIKAKAPEAKVLIMGYARLFPQSKPWSCFLLPASSSQFDELNRLALTMNKLLRSETDAASFEYVDVDELFQGHRYCEGWPPFYFQLSTPDKGAGHPTLEAIRDTYLRELKARTGC